MRLSKRIFAYFGPLAAAAVLCVAAQAQQNFGVAVGNSTVIKALDYSDTYTSTDDGGLPDRPLGGNPVSYMDYPVNGVVGEGNVVENCYGNPARSWPTWNWGSINTDVTAYSGTLIYPGGTGAGSDTGITQAGGNPATGFGYDYGIEYNLRDRFVVQFDAVQSEDRIDLGMGDVGDTIWGASNFTLFFRQAYHLYYPEVGLLCGSIGEVNTGLYSPIVYAGEWHNYAALFDCTERTIEVFIDQVSLGVIDVDTVGDGVFASVPMVNDYVYVGFGNTFTSQDRMWTDNFQVGSPDEPIADPVPGDATRDGYVTDADAQRLASNWLLSGAGVGWDQGDFNGDNVVDDRDAAILAAHWVRGGSEGGAVPEPGTWALLATGLIALGVWRKRG